MELLTKDLSSILFTIDALGVCLAYYGVVTHRSIKEFAICSYLLLFFAATIISDLYAITGNDTFGINFLLKDPIRPLIFRPLLVVALSIDPVYKFFFRRKKRGFFNGDN